MTPDRPCHSCGGEGMEFIDVPGQPDYDGTSCADCGGSGAPSPNRNRAAHGIAVGNGSTFARMFGSEPLDAWALSNLHTHGG